MLHINIFWGTIPLERTIVKLLNDTWIPIPEFRAGNLNSNVPLIQEYSLKATIHLTQPFLPEFCCMWCMYQGIAVPELLQIECFSLRIMLIIIVATFEKFILCICGKGSMWWAATKRRQDTRWSITTQICQIIPCCNLHGALGNRNGNLELLNQQDRIPKVHSLVVTMEDAMMAYRIWRAQQASSQNRI